MATRRKGWLRRLGERSAATHRRRITLYIAFIVAFVAGTVWLIADPSGATDGPRGWQMALAPAGIVLFGWGLVRELRTGDTRKLRPTDGVGGPRSSDPGE
jgi:hypothetical protein